MEESPKKSKAQRPTKKTKEQERFKERKCKGKRSAAEYRFVAEHSSSVEWLRQIKVNWA